MTVTQGAATRSILAQITFVLFLAFALVTTGCGQSYSASGTGNTNLVGGLPGGGGGGGGTGNSTATLEWDSPTTNVDQSCLTNLAGYVVTYGNTPGATTYQEIIPVSSLSCTNTATITACGTVQTCSYTVRGLSPGQWYFTAATYNSDLVSGPGSNEAVVTVN